MQSKTSLSELIIIEDLSLTDYTFDKAVLIVWGGAEHSLPFISALYFGPHNKVRFYTAEGPTPRVCCYLSLADQGDRQTHVKPLTGILNRKGTVDEWDFSLALMSILPTFDHQYD